MASATKAALEAQLARLRTVTGLDPLELLNMLESGLSVIVRADRDAHAQEAELAALRVRNAGLRQELRDFENARCTRCGELEQEAGEYKLSADGAARVNEALIGTLDKCGAPKRNDHTGERCILRLCEWLESRLETCTRLESEVKELQDEIRRMG